MENELLKDLVVIFAVAVATVVVLRRIGIPPIAGFIFAGVFVGPNVFGIVDDVHDVEVLAEVGVALLLFGIGLELSLDRVRRLWRLVLMGGALQVIATGAITIAILLWLGLEMSAAVLFGCVIAVSSTAIVLGALRTRAEIDAPHGRFTLGILVFQDLCVVPMILAIPLLSGSMRAGLLAGTLLKALGVLIAVLVCARLLVPRLLNLVANTRQRELFVLSVFLICIGTAWLVSIAGISLALGAFLAGLVVAGSGFRDQALSDLIPFREVFASIFFVSVGMLLDPGIIAANALPILIMVSAIVFGKALIATVSGLALRLPLRVSILAGLALAQVGEFSFVLLTAGRDAMALPQPFTDNLSVAIVITMLITPLIISASPHVAAGVVKMPVLTRRLGVPMPADGSDGFKPVKDHVIIAGYGLTGQEIADALTGCDVSHVVVDLNPENVRRALQHGSPAYFGDVTSAEVLQALGVEHARELVVVINDAGAAERAISETRRLVPALPVIARTQYVVDVERLVGAGATEVVAAELQTSVVMTRLILDRCQGAVDNIERHEERVRVSRDDRSGDE
jgi:CPA2 family monovalent cation:H+ antiporter-2